jgi:hypothetical protein
MRHCALIRILHCPAALALQRFQPVARRRVQIANGLRSVDQQQLAVRERLHVKRQ